MTFRDGLGDRHRVDDPQHGPGDVLTVRRELASVPSFEFALRERAARLSTFQHPSYASVRRVDRSADAGPELSIVSAAAEGTRLSDVLTAAAARGVPVTLEAALCLTRQLLPLVGMLHEAARDVAHGAIAPERIVVGPNGRLIITEYILGSALEQLLFSRERYWSELRIALPRVAGLPRFDHLADITQVGAVSLALILGRPLSNDEYPGRIGDVVASAMATSAAEVRQTLHPRVREWLLRMLQLDPRQSISSIADARLELDRVLADLKLVASPEHVEKFLSRVHARDAIVPDRTASPIPTTVAVPSVASSPAPLPGAGPAVTPSVVPMAPKAESETASKPDDELKLTLPEDGRKRSRLVTVGAAAAAVLAVVTAVALVSARRLLAVDPAPDTPSTSSLEITMRDGVVTAVVDGAIRGTTPLKLMLTPGPHTIELRGTEPAPAAVSPLALPAVTTPAATTPSADAAAAGWIAVGGPLNVDIFEGGQLLGSSRIDRIMLAAGRHDLELVNEQIGYRASRTVHVAPGKVASIATDAPKGAIALNALPWAEVWMDGMKVGETPIGNLSVPVGSHDVIFRHPELGEKRETVLVTLKSPARVSVDLRSR